MYGSPGGLEEWARQHGRARRRRFWRDWAGVGIVVGVWLLAAILDGWLGY